MPIAAAAVDICQPTGEKKRKEVDLAANNGSGPSKKRVRKRCSAEGCTNQAKKGGVCTRHGAKLKRCSVEECTKYSVKGGVCWRHGANGDRCEFEGCTGKGDFNGFCGYHYHQEPRPNNYYYNLHQLVANNGSGPPKKKYRYECSAEGCASKAQKGGVCIKHGAKVKRCSVDGCTKHPQNGGVCIRHGAKVRICSFDGCTSRSIKGGVCVKHGAKVKVNRCSVDGCNNKSKNGGVCITHGANGDRCSVEGCTKIADFSGFCYRHQEPRPNQNYYNLQIQQQQQQQQQERILRMGLASTMSSLGYRHRPPQWNNNNYYYYDNSLLNSNWVSHCNFEGCNIVATYGGFCSRHWTHRASSVAPRDHADSQRGYVQGGGNQNAATVEIISDDEEAGEKKQASITSRKRKEGVAKQSETPPSCDTGEIGEQNIPENKDAAPEKVKDKPNSSSVGDEGNSKDDKEPGASDQAVAEKKDSDSWGGGDCEYEAEDDNGAEFDGENQSRVDLEGEATANVEQESMKEVSPELMEPNNSAEALNARPEEMAYHFEDAQSRSKSECAKQQLSELKDLRTRLKDVMSELEKKSEAQERLELGWRKKEEELTSQVETSSHKLKEANDQVKDLSAELIALKEKLTEVKRNEAVTTVKLVEIANDAEATKALSEQQQSTIHELQASLSAKESELQRQSETASRLKANLRSKEAELKAHMQSSAVELKEMTTALNVKLVEATSKEAALNVQLKKITDDFAADRASLESKNNQQKFTIEDLCDRLEEGQSVLNEKSEAIADLTRRQAVMTNQMQISADKLKEAAADAVEVKARLRDANTNEKILKQQLKETRDKYEAANALSNSRLEQEKSANDKLRISFRDMESELVGKSEQFAADLRSKEVKMNEMTREMDVLNAKLAEATKNEGAVNAQLQRMTDDVETTRVSSESAQEQQQSTIDELRATLKVRQTELDEKNETAERLTAELRSKESEVKEVSMSTEADTLNVKLAEQAQVVASLKTEIEGARTEARTERESLKEVTEALDILKAKVSLLEEGKDREESTTTNSPKRVQRSRRSKNHPVNSLGAAVDQSSKYTGRRNRTPDEQDIPEELHGLEKELVQKKNNEIVVRGQEVTFDDIAGLEDAKNTVKEMVIYPMKRPDLFTGLRSCPKGLLLFGPPGTGKTMIGKAIAHESGATFFSISASSLKSKWIGEGEKLVKTLFAVASYQSPSVVFIDEVDSMLTQRKSDEDEASRSMKNEFLVQLDGAGNETKGHVLVIGATNLPHELDDAARRRFVKRLYIPLPDRAVREQQLRTLLANNRHSLKDNEIIKLSHATDGYSCADLKNLCTDASMVPMRSLTLTVEDLMRINADEVPPISYRHFRRSLRGMNPSVAQSDLQVHLDWNDKYGSKVTNDLDDDDDDYDSSDDENECCTPADAKQLSKIAGLDDMV